MEILSANLTYGLLFYCVFLWMYIPFTVSFILVLVNQFLSHIQSFFLKNKLNQDAPI